MQWVKNRSVTTKMVFLVSVMLLLTLILSVFGLTKMNKISDEIKEVAHQHIPLIQLISDVTVKQLQSTLIVEKALRASDFAKTVEQSEVHQLKQVFHQLSRGFDQEILEAKQLLDSSTSHSVMENIREQEKRLSAQLMTIMQLHQHYEKSAGEILDAILADETGETLTLKATELERQQDDHNQLLATFLKQVENMTQSAVNTTEQEEQHAIFGMILLMIIALVVGIFIGLWISRQIVKSLSHACHIAEEMAQGHFDVDIRIEGRDEVGRVLQSMKLMSESLGQVVSKVMRSADAIGGAVTELSVVAARNSESVEEQQQNTEQVATAMTEMAATITQIAASAEGASETSHRADKSLQSGCRTMSQTESLSGSLVESVKTSSFLITDLQKSTEQIQDFVSVVNGIAEQTNLLALNASIEAARAGEQGRGFAVVADEVRALASRSQEATQEIDALIESLVSNAGDAVSSIGQSGDKVSETSGLILSAKEQMDVIAQALTELSDGNTQVAAACEEQSVAAEQISQNMVHIRDVGHSVLMSVDETKRASEDLSIQADDLRVLMSRFRVKQATNPH
ncbi:Methyl-accepting chemotaxis protein McpS [Vibrio aerogenes CECT 7868]|uniref:Methyl-accepting chemotaxis protein McpS n=1 Tax=Vibrio aerogenes CECT 7868 TaxID=1216006 RepID=A0A1M5ZKM8_9VIBR|nr:methyl-accepting chemotaxis protein [Vibrio aerogenes]SHI24905.1 Methyl-accepting chemotaxis protein McpS [Vibrio aerogenes CECT 7868]